MPTKDQLRSIEWAGEDETCPACYALKAISGPSQHAHDCWLSAALATQDTLPPVEVGDVLAWRDVDGELTFGRVADAESAGYANEWELVAIYRTPLWQRWKE